MEKTKNDLRFIDKNVLKSLKNSTPKDLFLTQVSQGVFRVYGRRCGNIVEYGLYIPYPSKKYPLPKQVPSSG